MILDDCGGRVVIAHRGASGVAPENTIAALRMAADQGADAIEFDIRLSSCETPVLIHDPTLDRTTSLTGPVGARTAAELRDCGIPSLADALTELPDTPFLIELKTVEAAHPALQVLQRFGARKRVVVASFIERAVVPFRASGFLTSASRQGILKLWALSKIGLRGRSRDQAYSVPERYRDWITVPNPAFIRAAHKAGCPVHVWTVNDRSKARELWSRGVTGIITNYPAEMIAERGTL